MIEQVATAARLRAQAAVLHGNVAVSNVLFDGEGNAYLGDFRIGVGFTQKAAEDDVRGLASLAQGVLGSDEMPRMLAEFVDRAAVGSVRKRVRDRLAAGSGAQAQTIAAPLEAEVRNPFKGLRAFTEADAQDFFGRGELTTRLLSRLAEGGRGSPCPCAGRSQRRWQVVGGQSRAGAGDPRSAIGAQKSSSRTCCPGSIRSTSSRRHCFGSLRTRPRDSSTCSIRIARSAGCDGSRPSRPAEPSWWWTSSRRSSRSPPTSMSARCSWSPFEWRRPIRRAGCG